MIYTKTINASLLKIKVKAPMILTCPNCSSTFQLPASALAPEGKKVKCKNCGSIWFQLPDPDELLEDLEETVAEEQVTEQSATEQTTNDEQEAQEDAAILEPEALQDVLEDDIPDAVKPREEFQPANTAIGQAPVSKAKYFAIAAGIVLLAVSPIFTLQNTMLKAWPQSIALYNAFGLIDTSASEGLIFDQIRANIDGETLNIVGQIINLKAKDTILPSIEIALRDKDGVAIKSWYVDMPQTKLEAEGVLPFQSDMVLSSDMSAAKIKDIQTRFVLMKATPELSQMPKDHHKSDAGE